MDLLKPCVIKGAIETWPGRLWNTDFLAYLLNRKKLTFRLGRHSAKTVLWEGDCIFVEASVDEFNEWSKGEIETKPVDSKNPLFQYSRDEFWCYADYKYIASLFENKEEIYQAIKWRTCGLPGYNGKQSTLWIGSEGAYTPCHQDTYGFNLVAQIHGRKRWHLFPPHQTDCLYPTRVPYEESSVFSQVHVANPDLMKHHKFGDATPYVVTLEPGDVLYVPKQWWHYVECLEVSVSVNCWVDLESDHLSRFQEAISRLLVCRLLDNKDSANPVWLNPTEELTTLETNLTFLKRSWAVLQEKLQPQANGQKEEDDEVMIKFEKIDYSKQSCIEDGNQTKNPSQRNPEKTFIKIEKEEYASGFARCVETSSEFSRKRNFREESNITIASRKDVKRRKTSSEVETIILEKTLLNFQNPVIPPLIPEDANQSLCHTTTSSTTCRDERTKSQTSFQASTLVEDEPTNASNLHSKTRTDIAMQVFNVENDSLACSVASKMSEYSKIYVPCKGCVRNLVGTHIAEDTHVSTTDSTSSHMERMAPSLEDVAKCVTHPSVVSLISEMLLNQ